MCLARTADAATPYQGLTLFLVPLDAPGVSVGTLPTAAEEQYADVRLDAVRVGPDAVVGPVGWAWPLVTSALALERTGVDTAAKARRGSRRRPRSCPPPRPRAAIPAAAIPAAVARSSQRS